MRKIYLLLIASILLCLSCEKLYEKKTYYKTIGEGYVFDVTDPSDIKPLKGATILVRSFFSGGDDLFGTSPAEEEFTSDENGYYQVRFIKRTHYDKVQSYIFRVRKVPSQPSHYSYNFLESLSIEDIKDKKLITLDTIKIHIKEQ